MEHLTREGRDLLDGRVRAIDWDEAACALGSPQRREVASWLAGTDLVDSQMRRLFPDAGQRERMAEYTSVRVTEKITGLAIESNAASWNPNNLWDPKRGTSFCAWARRLAYAVARQNAPRVLHPRAMTMTRLEHEDGYNEAVDESSSTMLMAGGSDDVFDAHPDLRVPRPVGEDTARWRALARRSGAAGAASAMRGSGLWDASLDVLDDEEAAALMLAPVRADLEPVFARQVGDMELAELYWPTQLKRPVLRGMAELRRAVAVRAESGGSSEWSVWCLLGTAAARTV
jgi:hypothetical protein